PDCRDRGDLRRSVGARGHPRVDFPRRLPFARRHDEKLSCDVRLPGHGLCIGAAAAMAADPNVVSASDRQPLAGLTIPLVLLTNRMGNHTTAILLGSPV